MLPGIFFTSRQEALVHLGWMCDYIQYFKKVTVADVRSRFDLEVTLVHHQHGWNYLSRDTEIKKNRRRGWYVDHPEPIHL